MSLSSIAVILFLIMNSIGHIPAFVAVLERFDSRARIQIILREVLFAALILIFFYFCGRNILHILEVKSATVQMSGGIVLFLKAVKMIFPRIHKADDIGSLTDTPFIVPIATPLLVGPSVLAMVIVYSSQSNTFSYPMLVSILSALAASASILFSAFALKKILGHRGVNACERLMGLVLLLLAIEMILSALHNFIDALPIL